MTLMEMSGRTTCEKPAAGPSPPVPRSTRKCWLPYGTSRRMAMCWTGPFRFLNKRDIAIDGEIVEHRGREFLPRPIRVRGSGGDLLRLLAGKIRGAGIQKCTNGAGRRKKFDVAKQRQLRNGGSPAEALEWRVEGNVDP